MNWKFWQKEPAKVTGSEAKPEKLQGPRDIPEPVGRDLVVKLSKDPDWVWSLKSVLRHRQDKKDVYDVRVFNSNDAAMKKIAVKNFTSLDEHPELILFEGWYNKKSRDVHIDEKGKTQSPAKAA